MKRKGVQDYLVSLRRSWLHWDEATHLSGTEMQPPSQTQKNFLLRSVKAPTGLHLLNTAALTHSPAALWRHPPCLTQPSTLCADEQNISAGPASESPHTGPSKRQCETLATYAGRLSPYVGHRADDTSLFCPSPLCKEHLKEDRISNETYVYRRNSALFNWWKKKL